VVFAALAAPPAVLARHPSDSRHPNPHGRQENRYAGPQRRPQSYSRCYWSVPPPCPQPVVVYPAYYPPPPPPPVAYWGYYPPPPPPPPPYCYPQPGFQFVFSF
jgi:hypothetical protein